MPGQTNADQLSHLAEVCNHIRRTVPGATVLYLETSDQQPGHGFTISDVCGADDRSVLDEGPEVMDALSRPIDEPLSLLARDGVVGEDKHGYAAVRLDNSGQQPSAPIAETPTDPDVRQDGTSGELPVRKFLDVSTSHLQEDTCRDLNCFEGVTAYDIETGWFMYATPRAAEYAERHDWPAELLPIVTLARAKGCDYVLFDRDADVIDGLPHWDW